jgi:hypothetical protein
MDPAWLIRSDSEERVLPNLVAAASSRQRLKSADILQ